MAQRTSTAKRRVGLAITSSESLLDGNILPESADAVNNVLHYNFDQLIHPSEFLIRTIIADEEYLPVPITFVRNMILTDPILSPARYQKDRFDCDDYVQYLRTKAALYTASNQLQAPLAIGCIFTTLHAFNFCIDQSSTLVIINTQSTNRGVSADRNEFSVFLGLSNINIIKHIYI